MGVTKKLSKVRVNYRTTTSETRKCTNCSMYRALQNDSNLGTCTLVQGLVSKGHVCDRWKVK